LRGWRGWQRGWRGGADGLGPRTAVKVHAGIAADEPPSSWSQGQTPQAAAVATMRRAAGYSGLVVGWGGQHMGACCSLPLLGRRHAAVCHCLGGIMLQSATAWAASCCSLPLLGRRHAAARAAWGGGVRRAHSIRPSRCLPGQPATSACHGWWWRRQRSMHSVPPGCVCLHPHKWMARPCPPPARARRELAGQPALNRCASQAGGRRGARQSSQFRPPCAAMHAPATAMYAS